MPAINLLPDEQRKKEIEEQKMKTIEKSKVSIELTNPSKKIVTKTPSAPSGLKKFFSSIFKGKDKVQVSKEAKIPLANLPINNQLKPSLPPTPPKFNLLVKETGLKSEIQPNLEQKKVFYFQSPAPTNLPESKKPEPLISEVKKPVIPQPPKVESRITPLVGEPKVFPAKPTAQLSAVSPKEKTVSRLNINLVPEKIKSAFAFKNKTIIFGAIIAGCILLLFLGGLIFNHFVNQRQAQASDLEDKINQLVEQINQQKKTTGPINSFVSLTNEAKKLIDQHVFWTNVLKLLQENTLKQVYYTQMKADFTNTAVELVARAENYEIMSQQIIFFQDLKDKIEKVEVGEIEIEKEKETVLGQPAVEFVSFNLTLTFKPEVFQQ